MKKFLLTISLILLAWLSIGIYTVDKQELLQVSSSSLNLGALNVLRPAQGGTGIGTATAGDVGDCLAVLDDSPFTYELTTCGAGGGEVNTGSSVGTGLNIYDSKVGANLRFNSLAAGTNITLSTTSNSNTIVINSTASGSGAPAFTPTSYGASTSTTLGFLNGFFSTASSTISSALRLPSLSQGVLYVGSTGLVNTIASSSLNVGTATALAANGANCSSGSAPLGVDASGAAENCFDVWTEAENTSAAYTPQSRTLTMTGTANQITLSAGAQDLSANRTWTYSFPSLIINPNASTTLFSNFGTAYFGGSATTTITPAGYVGVGTSSPYGNLSINAPAQTNPYFVIGSSTSEVLRVSPSTTGGATLTLSTTTAGCLNINTVGLIYSATCAGGGSVTSVVAGIGFLNRGLNINGSGTLNVGIATSATPSISGLSFWTGIGDASNPATLGSVATTSVTCAGTVSCTTFTAIGSAPITLTGSGGGGSVSTSTVDWVIYKRGTNTVVYDTITNTDVLTTTSFGAACNYIVNQATSTFPARTDVAVRFGTYNAGADCVISGNSNQYSPQFNFNFNSSTTPVYVTSGQNAFSFKDQAQVRINNLTCALAGSGNCLFASTSAGTSPQSSVRESIFYNLDAYSTTTHTGWVVDFKEDFRNKFTDFDWKFTANGYRSQNNYTNAQFINGDSTFERGFVELCDASVGIGYVFKLDGVRGQVNQNTFSDINGIDCEANGTASFFYGLNATRNRVENFNVEEMGTTTEVYGSSGSLFAFGNTFSSNKYKTNGNTSGVTFFTNTNSFNNQYECWEEEVEGAVVLFRDLNTLDTQAPNAFGNFSGGVCRLNDNGGSVSMSTTTTSIVQSLRDNITGAFSYTNSVKLSSGKIFFNFQNAVTTFLEYLGSALRFTVGGNEMLTLTSTRAGIASSTPTHTLSVGSSNTATFGISTTTNGCAQFTNGLLWITGTACGSGVGGTSAFEIATSSSLALSQVAYISQVSGRTTLSGVATSSLVNGTGITITNGSSAFVLGAQPTFNCNTASASVFGCLAASDFSKFNSATTTFGSGYATTTLGTLTFSTTTLTRNGQTFGMTIVPSAGALTFTPTLSGTLDNAGLTNSTISGVALGSNLNALTNDATLNGSSYNGSGAISDWGLNLANANTWTVNQTFNYSSSTVYSSFVTSSTTNARIGLLTLSTTTAGTLKTDANGVVWADTSGGGGGGYATIQDEGSNQTTRTILNFTGSGVACADDTTRTTCTINAGAASAGGSDTQVQFNDGSSLGGAVAWIWNKTMEIMGIGTTTLFSNHKVSIATSTGQNLVLLTGDNDAGISFRNIAGSLYLGSTSPTTGATSTSPSALVVDYSSGVGKVGVGSTTPWGKFGILQDDYSVPALTIGTSTASNGFGVQFHVTATSSTLVSNTVNGKRTEVGVRVGVGLYDYEGYGGLLDQFTVNGRINTQGWLDVRCDNAQTVALSADGIMTACPSFYFAEDGIGTTGITTVTGGGATYTRVAASSGTANVDGAGVFVGNNTSTGWLTLATSTPVLETNFRIRNSTATTSIFFIGYSNIGIATAGYETEPTAGCYFTASSTTPNWRAICRTAAGGANMTMVDTGIASTSVTNGTAGTGYQFRKFRIQADSNHAEFFIKETGSSNLVKVAQISTTYPVNTLLNAGVHYGIISQNTSSGFDFFRLRFWWRDVLPSL